jgi:hypothetical protein
MTRSGQTLERELCETLGTGRNALIAARYYGFDGRGGGSLQTVGNEIGVTRERARQIVTTASKGVRGGGRVLPALDRTIAFVVDHMPGAAGEIEAELLSQRLTSGLFRLEGVIRAAELLGRPVPFSITEVSEERLVYAPEIPSVDRIVRIARRVISRQGIANISDVMAEVRKVEFDVCDRKLVVCALACLGSFHWLEQSANWFWLADSRNNPVLYRIGKVLSVANPIHVSALWAGIRRDPAIKRLSVPKRVLLEFCRQSPRLHVRDEVVKATPAINSDAVLTHTEKAIVHLLSERGGTMTTSELTSACLGMGINRQTFYRNVENSPIISRRAGSLYRLIGSGQIRRR